LLSLCSDRLQHLVDDRILTSLVCLAGANLLQLHISNAPLLTEECLSYAVTHLPRLERIDIYSCSRAVSDRVVTLLAEYRNEGLREIHFGASSRITDDSIHALARHCPRLRGIGVSYSAVTIVGVQMLMQHCPHLISHRVRIHLAGDPLAPLEWPPQPQDIARCQALMGSPEQLAELEEQALDDAQMMSDEPQRVITMD
jgi:hypothetical protein